MEPVRGYQTELRFDDGSEGTGRGGAVTLRGTRGHPAYCWIDDAAIGGCVPAERAGCP